MGRIAKASATAGPRSQLRSLDVEAARLFLAPGDIGHDPVGGLDMARRASRIEQRTSVAIAGRRFLVCGLPAPIRRFAFVETHGSDRRRKGAAVNVRSAPESHHDATNWRVG
jgi:hypothetical protein